MEALTAITFCNPSIIKCSLEAGDSLDPIKELLTISVSLEIIIIVLLVYSILILIFSFRGDGIKGDKDIRLTKGIDSSIITKISL